MIFDNSDIITFHNYRDADNLHSHIIELKKLKRPIINTEWLNRARGSFVSTHLTVLKEENVGCMHWGLVNGKTQTHLHWGWRACMGEPDVWQHDLYNLDHVPYDKDEIELFLNLINQDKLTTNQKAYTNP